jgi:glycosyltransferase involved in cell wall biosynthesis
MPSQYSEEIGFNVFSSGSIEGRTIMAEPLKVTHIITGLSTGGAEMMLYKLLAHLDRGRFSCNVISLTMDGSVGDKIRGLGVPVQISGMRSGVPDPLAVLRLAGRLRSMQPDLVQTWMYHADLVGGLAARLAGRASVVWGIRNSNLDVVQSKRSTRWTVKACAFLSRWLPRRIVSCSETARRIHIGLGYRAEKLVVIPNGFDLELFHPDPSARCALREELDLPPIAPVIGLVGRFNPQKDHQNFIQAAAIVAARFSEAHFLLCGEGVTSENSLLQGWIISNGLEQKFRLLGQRNDIPRVTAAMDIGCSSSAYGEAFSNVLGEAMACEVPCVATDVGDSAYIIADTGHVVPPRDPQALANALLDLLVLSTEQRQQLGTAARQRIEENFEINAVAKRYENLYRQIVPL